MMLTTSLLATVTAAVVRAPPTPAEVRSPHNITIFTIYGSDADPAAELRAAGINTQLGGPSGSAQGGFNFTAVENNYAEHGLATFVDIAGIWSGRSGLISDWQPTVTALIDATVPHFASGAVTGIFMGDEITCDGVPVSNLTAAANFIKASLRRVGHGQVYVYVNECKSSFIGRSCDHPGDGTNGTQNCSAQTCIDAGCAPDECWHCGGREYAGWIHGKLPQGLDLISIDSYELGNQTHKTVGHPFPLPTPWWLAEPLEIQRFYKEVVEPKLWPHQRLMITPGLYGNNSYGVPNAAHELQDRRLVAKMDQYWQWIKDDPLVVGINPYHWGNARSGVEGPNCTAEGHCLTMCYGDVCGKDGELFGEGCQAYPQLMRRMAEIGHEIEAERAETGQ